MSEPDSIQEARRWLRYATEDLIGAQHQLADRATAPRLACVLAQQAAEKAIKAVLIFLQVDFPFRHDLDTLRGLVPPGWEVKTGHAYLSDLTDWAVEGRYPGGWPEATEADAKLAVEQAGEVVQSITDDLRVRGLRLETE